MRLNSLNKERYVLATLTSHRKLSCWLLAGVAGLALVGCQQDMATQPYYQPLEENRLFADKRASRPLVAGTVARGDLREDDAYFTGRVDGELVDEFPMTITEEIIARGENRFNIYCAPCHSKLGDGNGMIVQRGMVQPPSFMDDRLVTAPVGHVYDVITNGYGRMFSFNQQLPVRDRWAIVSYVKTLQVAGRGELADVPPAELDLLMKQEPVTTPTATLAGNETAAVTGGTQ